MKIRFALLAVAGLALGACETGPYSQTSPQVRNAAVGAAGGAVAGQLLGGDTESTLAGAAIGGVGGALVGAEQERRQMEAQRRQVYGY
jgi:osmotically inducible lipoprotein OsmB